MDRGTVLVIDEDANLRSVIDIVLQAMGLHVELAASGREGLEKARTLLPDLILLDDRLPDLPNREMLRRVQGMEAPTDVPVVVMTAFPGREGAPGGRADDLLQKPFELEQLEGIVCRCLNLPPSDPGSRL